MNSRKAYDPGYFDNTDWQELEAWEQELADTSPQNNLHDGSAAHAELFIQKWTYEDGGTDGLGILWLLLHQCITRGLAWVATRIAFVGYRNALKNSRDARCEVSPGMVWASIERFGQLLEEKFPVQAADFWESIAANLAKNQDDGAQLFLRAGQCFVKGNRSDLAFVSFRSAFERFRASGDKLSALKAYSKANQVLAGLGKIDSLATDFGLDVNGDQTIQALATAKVFLGGTDDVKDVMNQLYKELPRYGYKPLWFHREFEVGIADAMDECLNNVVLADRFLLVLDKRYGLPYRASEVSITEKEFQTAYQAKKPILVFVRQETWNSSRLFHAGLKVGGEPAEVVARLGIKGDTSLYCFIERIQHLRDEGGDRIPWVVPFAWADDIIKSIVDKWGVSF
jgi:hypothetical protein